MESCNVVRSFCDWLLSLSIAFSKFIYAKVGTMVFHHFLLQAIFHANFIIFLLQSNIPHYAYTTFQLSIFWGMNIWTVFTLGYCEEHCYEYLHATFYIDIYIFFLLGTYLGVELLGHSVTLCLTLWGTARLFFTSSCIILHSHQLCKGVPVSPYPHQHVLLFVFLLLLLLEPSQRQEVPQCTFNEVLMTS